MRGAILGLMIGLTAATPAQGARFAIACNGKNIMGVMRNGALRESDSDIRNIVYVIDEEAQTVHRFDPRGNKLDEVCANVGLPCDRSFSADRIVIAGSRTGTSGDPTSQFRTTISFDWNRQTGALTSTHDLQRSNGMGLLGRFVLKCAPTAMPTFASRTI